MVQGKQKLCFLVDHIATVGGVQRVVKVVASLLSEQYDVTIFCDDEPELLPKIDGVKVVSYYGKNVSQNSRSIWKRILGRINRETGLLNHEITIPALISTVYPEHVLQFWARNLRNYDIAVGVQAYPSFLLGILKNRIPCMTVGWQHSSFDAYFRTKGMYSWNTDCLAKYAISNLDAYVVLNEEYQKDIKREFNLDVDVIYNPRSFKSQEKSPLCNKVFLAAGHLLPAKGFDRLIDSFAIFAKQEKEWKLRIFGEGKDREYLQNKIDAATLGDRITIHPYSKDIKRCFLDASAYLLSSRWEGMPMIALEALELGVPIAAYDIKAIAPIITDGVEGYIAPDGDVEAYAQNMVQITRDFETGKLKKMSAQAAIKSELFSEERIVACWKTLFSGIMEKRRNEFSEV